MRPVHVVGLFLWRGGILLVAGWVFVTIARAAIRFLRVPAQVEIGLGLLVAGGALVLVSLVLERIRDYRLEKDLRE
ncbi:hypothetical protein JW916_02940 [Candidatus Sumerlaeota bacterium]|nr:hypothetical protein [Candidatus Sumerlaeota bacterium]